MVAPLQVLPFARRSAAEPTREQATVLHVHALFRTVCKTDIADLRQHWPAVRTRALPHRA